ncbi:RNA-directed DNA polymerase, eukaryota [Tanacetum coccineum]
MNLTMSQICLAATDDRWSWDLNGEGSFVVKDLRNLIDDFMLPKEENVTRWIKYIPIKVNIFAWKVRLNRLPSRINLSQRGILLDSLDCPVCSDAPEDLYHCIFRCEVVNGIMILFCRWWNIDWVPINSYDEWLLWFNFIRLNSKIKKLLEGACYVMWWHLWNFRNQTLFGSCLPRRSILFDEIILKSFTWISNRCNRKFSRDSWMQNPSLIPL